MTWGATDQKCNWRRHLSDRLAPCEEHKIIFAFPASETDLIEEGLRAIHGGEAVATLARRWTREPRMAALFTVAAERTSRPRAGAAWGERIRRYG
jgi:hypothetical protein